MEEKLLSNYYLDPFLIVGTEGMWGIAYYMGVLPLMQLKTCGYSGGALAGMCNFGYLENSAYGFQQMVDNKILILQTAGSICSIAAFNSFGIATTKYASAAQRSTIDTSRTVVIWVLSCLLMGLGNLCPSLDLPCLLVALLFTTKLLLYPSSGLINGRKQQSMQELAKTKMEPQRRTM